jgi:hypothetical protein
VWATRGACGAAPIRCCIDNEAEGKEIRGYKEKRRRQGANGARVFLLLRGPSPGAIGVIRINLTVPVFSPADNAPLRMYTVLTRTSAPAELWRPLPARCVAPTNQPLPSDQDHRSRRPACQTRQPRGSGSGLPAWPTCRDGRERRSIVRVKAQDGAGDVEQSR